MFLFVFYKCLKNVLCFLLSYVSFVLKTCNIQICCISHWQIALSLFFSVYHSVLTDKLVDINYREKSLEWAETDTDSDSDCELISRCRTLAVERLCFCCTFYVYFIKVRKHVFTFFVQKLMFLINFCYDCYARDKM